YTLRRRILNPLRLPIPPSRHESQGSSKIAALAEERALSVKRARHTTPAAPAMSLTLDDFDYPLPPELIAQTPLAERSASRLLVVEAPLRNARITDLPELLRAGDLLVMNDTRVLHARL